MKPQCTTAAECFREVGRVMEQFNCQTYNTAASRGLIKQNGCDSTLTPYNAHKLLFLHPEEWQFAIAEVEGRPVFIGDELYSSQGNRFTVGNYESYRDEFEEAAFHDYKNGRYVAALCTWNPPRPKTVMVELPLEVAEAFTNPFKGGVGIEDLQEVAEACRKALEGMKE